MEANEAPKKIYLYPDDRAGYEYEAEWGDKPWGEDCVEYTRTDAFIEKADKFISSFFHPDDTELKNGILDEFHKYMKGE